MTATRWRGHFAKAVAPVEVEERDEADAIGARDCTHANAILILTNYPPRSIFLVWWMLRLYVF